ncbi:MAG: RNA polymerase sigma-70 factor [Saprospiraceae bacterium]|nr:RNA polymerase sigma-70 factor [Saprospiraceae bacterium]
MNQSVEITYIQHHKNIQNKMYVKHKDMNDKIKQIQEVKSVDNSTFEQLFTDHYDALYRYCQTMVKDQNDTEDIIQSVFMDLWNDRQKLVIHTSIKAYLFKAIYFKCMNKIKHDKVAFKYSNTVLNAENTTATDTLIIQEIAAKITETIESLPEQCRKIFSMSRMDGLRYNEIAEKLNLSPKTIENQIGKALKTMRVALSEYIQIIVFTILTYL